MTTVQYSYRKIYLKA